MESCNFFPYDGNMKSDTLYVYVYVLYIYIYIYIYICTHT